METPPALASISAPSVTDIEPAGGEPRATVPGAAPGAASPMSTKAPAELSAISLSIDARPEPAPAEPAPTAEPGIELAAIGTAAGMRSAAESFVEEPKPGLVEPPSEGGPPSTELSAIAPRQPAEDVEPPAGEPAAAVERDAPRAGGLGAMKVRSAVNMRAEPDNGAGVVGVIPEGRRVDVIECKIWCRVAFEGKRGWVFKSFLSGFDAPRQAKAQKAPKPPAPLAPLGANPKLPCDDGWSSTALAFLREGFGAGSSPGGCGTAR
jgi:hypothetical protein